eukprot:363474-Chlamydomonas_euryale.AAC.21
MQLSIQRGWKLGIQPGKQRGWQPGMRQVWQSNTQPGMQPGWQPGMQPCMQPGWQPGMHQGWKPNILACSRTCNRAGSLAKAVKACGKSRRTCHETHNPQHDLQYLQASPNGSTESIVARGFGHTLDFALLTSTPQVSHNQTWYLVSSSVSSFCPTLVPLLGPAELVTSPVTIQARNYQVSSVPPPTVKQHLLLHQNGVCSHGACARKPPVQRQHVLSLQLAHDGAVKKGAVLSAVPHPLSPSHAAAAKQGELHPFPPSQGG